MAGKGLSVSGLLNFGKLGGHLVAVLVGDDAAELAVNIVGELGQHQGGLAVAGVDQVHAAGLNVVPFGVFLVPLLPLEGQFLAVSGDGENAGAEVCPLADPLIGGLLGDGDGAVRMSGAEKLCVFTLPDMAKLC